MHDTGTEAAAPEDSPAQNIPSSERPTASEINGPLQWSSRRKAMSVAVVSYAECLTFIISMMLAPSLPQVMHEFRPAGNDKPLGSFFLTIYMLGNIAGPLLFGPLTDLVGRIYILRFTETFFLLFTLACALSTSLPMLIVFRFFAGCFGGGPVAIGGGIISDLYAPGERTQPMAWYGAGMMLGPIVGPVLGGIITGGLGWRWVFWIATIMIALCLGALCFVLEETHQAAITERARVMKEMVPAGKKRSLVNSVVVDWKHLDLRNTFARSMKNTIKIARQPSSLAILPLALVFMGFITMILSSLGWIFQSQYHFPATTAGLPYLGLGFGGVVGVLATPPISRFFGQHHSRLQDSKRPQYVLPMMVFAGPFICAALLGYGWSTQTRLHWIVPELCLLVYGFGYTGVRLSSQIFIMNSAPHHTASALAAYTVFASIGSTVIPLGTFPLYDALGLGWGNSVIALLHFVLFLWTLAMLLLFLRSKKGEAEDGEKQQCQL